MKKIFFVLLLLNASVLLAQSNQDPQDKQWRQEMSNRNGFPASPQSPMSNKNRVEEVMKSFPAIILPRREMTKEEIEEIRKSEEALNALRAPLAEDFNKYGEFLKQKNTGIFRLFPDLGCDGKLMVKADDDCANALSLSWSYSIINRYYGTSSVYDLRLKENSLVADGFLAQNIITPLGNIDLNSVALESNGIKYLKDFKPEKKSQKAKEQFTAIAKKVNVDGYIYGKIINLQVNQTYGMRVIAYRLADRHKVDWTQKGKLNSKDELVFYNYQDFKGADKIVAFRVIRKDIDGSVTILWKELSNKKAPIIVFEKNEKMTDLKVAQ